MLEIDHLSLTLPAGFGPRAARIARLTAQALAAHGLGGHGAVAQLQAAPLRVDAARSDHHIARQIADHVAALVTPHTGDTGDGPC